MRMRRARTWSSALLLVGLACAARAGEVPPGPESREIPPDRGKRYLLQDDFRLCMRRLMSRSTPLEQRIEAIGSLAILRDERAVPSLVRLVTDEKRQEPIAVRVAALWGLGEIGDPRGIPALQLALDRLYHDDKNWAYGKGILTEIGGEMKQISLEDMVTAQLAALAEPLVGPRVGPDGKVKPGFVDVLMKPVASGITQAEDGEADKRRAALVTLAAIGDRDGRAVKALCDVLRADDKYFPWDFKIIAAQALSHLVEQRRKLFEQVDATDELLDQVAAAFIEGAAVTDVPEVREIVGISLRTMGWADRAGRQLAIVLESPVLPTASRYRIIEALAFIRSPEAAEALIVQLFHDDRNVRWRAAIALGATGHDNAVGFLSKLTTNPPEKDHFVRMKAVAALGHLRDPAAVPHLAVALEDRDWRVRREAARALGRSRELAALPALTNTGLRDPSPTVRAVSILALAEIKQQEGIKRVAELITSTDPKVREASASVRFVAVQVLDRFLNDWVTNALVVALGDEDEKVRDAAAASIHSRLAHVPKHVLPLLAEIVAKGKDPSRANALRCIAEDYRNPRARTDKERRALYDDLLGEAGSPFRVALLRIVEDQKAEAKAREVAADLLVDIAWRRAKKDKGILERVAALDRDPNLQIRTVARLARNYLANLP